MEILIEILKITNIIIKNEGRTGISLVNQVDIFELTKSTEKRSGH